MANEKDIRTLELQAEHLREAIKKSRYSQKELAKILYLSSLDPFLIKGGKAHKITPLSDELAIQLEDLTGYGYLYLQGKTDEPMSDFMLLGVQYSKLNIEGRLALIGIAERLARTPSLQARKHQPRKKSKAYTGYLINRAKAAIAEYERLREAEDREVSEALNADYEAHPIDYDGQRDDEINEYSDMLNDLDAMPHDGDGDL